MGDYSISIPSLDRASLEQKFWDAFEEYENQRPKAEITASLVSIPGEPATLDGSRSSDPDGDTLSYHWMQTEGPNIAVSGGSTSTLSFIMPTVSQPTLFTFQLTVDDGDLSSTASLSFHLSSSTTALLSRQPNIVVTALQSFFTGEVVTLDGSGTYDPDGDTLSYQWTQTNGPKIELSNSSSATLTFVAPTVSQTTPFTFQLTTGDGVLSTVASVSIQVSPPKTSNSQPSAKITAPQPPTSGQTVTLDGSGSFDPDDNILSYQWRQTKGPEITLSDSSSSSLTFVAPSVEQPTEFSFELTVHDGELSNSASVTVLISPITDNTPPSIVSRSPQPDQGGVSPTAEISVGFDEALLESSVDSLSLSVSQNNRPVPGVVSYDSANKTITIKLTSALSSSATYTVTLANTLEDLSGNAFAGESWSFHTSATD